LDPRAKGQALLYTSDEQGDAVYVFSVSSRKLVGMLNDFEFPTGECVDKSGDVWITDFSLAEIFEYAHGGTAPIAELNDLVGGPVACAIDPNTGDLAVANAQNTILVYEHAAGTPKVYTSSDVLRFEYCAYDEVGDLFADGSSNSNLPLVEPANGAEKLRSVQGIYDSGSLQWDGKYLAISSIVYGQQFTRIDRAKIAGYAGKVVQTVALRNPRSPFDGQFWIQGGTVIGPTGGPRGNAQILEAWAYPGGGGPKHAYRTHGSDYVTLDGVVISKASVPGVSASQSP
jgi:hypothetical protein